MHPPYKPNLLSDSILTRFTCLRTYSHCLSLWFGNDHYLGGKTLVGETLIRCWGTWTIQCSDNDLLSFGPRQFDSQRIRDFFNQDGQLLSGCSEIKDPILGSDTLMLTINHKDSPIVVTMNRQTKEEIDLYGKGIPTS